MARIRGEPMVSRASLHVYTVSHESLLFEESAVRLIFCSSEMYKQRQPSQGGEDRPLLALAHDKDSCMCLKGLWYTVCPSLSDWAFRASTWIPVAQTPSERRKVHL